MDDPDLELVCELVCELICELPVDFPVSELLRETVDISLPPLTANDADDLEELVTGTLGIE